MVVVVVVVVVDVGVVGADGVGLPVPAADCASALGAVGGRTARFSWR